MVTDIILRPALATDARRIRDLIHRVGINPMDLDWRHFVIAEDADGHFLGCCQLKTHRDGSPELASLAVVEEYRRQGVARALIEHLLAHSPRPLFLMCRPGLVPFYEKFAFRACTSGALPPYFRRINRLMQALIGLNGGEAPAILCLEGA